MTKKDKLRAMKRYFLTYGHLNCVYCNKDTFPHLENGHEAKTTIDHIIPISKGGSNRKENITIACYECNFNKADK